MARTTNSKTTATTKPTIEVPSPADLQAALDDAQLLLYRDRRRAHATLFGGAHRKSHATPDFHWEMIDDWHSPIRKLLQKGFRGSAKTTIGEEGVTINALFREFRYFLIASSIDEIAEMRLHAIKKQFETNESILEIFGNLKSRPWEDNHIELSTGVVFRAVGRGKSIRGTKDADTRPDFIWFDDIEDWKAVANETQIKKTLTWFDGEIGGSADEPNLRMRMTANDMGSDCLANKLRLPNSGWECRVYPWIIAGKSIWEDRYPLADCLKKRAEMYERGTGDEYEREYMCSSERPEAKTFRDEFLKIESRVRVYEPTYAMIVPEPQQSGLAVTKCAAAVWSWIGGKCVVWECWSRNLAADKIVAECERIDSEYRPVKLGFEKDALDGWAHASVSSPAIVPVKTKADDLDFIRAMQPFFVGKQISFAAEPREAWPQFTAFPNGPNDAPRALAFALHPDLRTSEPAHADFSAANIAPDILPEAGPMMLALNADDKQTIGVMCQIGGAGLRVFVDWLARGNDPSLAARIVQQANLAAQRRCSVVIPGRHYERGKDRLPASLRRIGIQTSAGGNRDEGQREIARMLREQSRGVPRVLVCADARWTMNGFLGGYTSGLEDGPYPLVIEALESLVALAAFGDMLDDARTNAVAKDGRQFFSARPVR